MTTHTDACTLQVDTPRKQHVTLGYRPGTVRMQPEAGLLGFIYPVTPSPQALVSTGEIINFNWVSKWSPCPPLPSQQHTPQAQPTAPLEADGNSHVPFHGAMCGEETEATDIPLTGLYPAG